MKTTSIVAVAAAVIVVLAAVSVVFLYNGSNNDDDRQTVLVTMAWEKEIVEEIAGNEYDVITIVGSGESPHSDLITPSVVASLNSCAVYFMIGSGPEIENVLEEAAGDIFKEANVVSLADANGITFVNSYAVEVNTGYNGHIWTSPDNLQAMAKYIMETLTNLNPGEISKYQKNYETYCDDVATTNEKVKELAEAIITSGENQTVVLWHPAWPYLVHSVNSYLSNLSSNLSLSVISLEITYSSVTPEAVATIEADGGIIYVAPFDAAGQSKETLKEAGVDVIEINPTVSDMLGEISSFLDDLIDQYSSE
ncbi:MAG: zinc ABC transporter substrate-binding protein [Candidatus Methanomethylophilaceae archaeon]|nr:zinc ABC transporter substrate-binding protein [Candidatus Methanomethylophilaceae archaeon]